MYVVRNYFQCRMAGVTDGTKDSQLAHPHPVYIPSSRQGSPLAVKHSRCVSHFVNCHSKISDQKRGGVSSELKDTVYHHGGKDGDNGGFSYDGWNISQLAIVPTVDAYHFCILVWSMHKEGSLDISYVC